eukprot:Gregarina_sp_Pseudo_9__5937@NODE_954_length_2035_cov_294_783066_g855_i1_p1_GENE_NODE_954_length_2035_cov_294_783066_g855_i1NODE_954_length_2035_cov_294_783066_g855_i1_p1_ORF_typecomplete_len556_score173_43Lipase_3/PF01764_25/9_9e05_NODE_954_length_2035_cov_294_783066_g855_i11351802
MKHVGQASVLLLGLVSGVSLPETDFYPIIEYWKAGDFRANPLCEGVNAPQIPAKVAEYPSRTSTGLKLFARDLLRKYDNAVKSTSLKDLSYSASQRRRVSDWSALTLNPMTQTVIDARSKSTEFRGYKDFFCDNIQSAKPEEFCSAMANYTRTMQCFNLYEYENRDAVLQSLSQDADYGFSPVPGECLEPISAGVRGQDLKWDSFAVTPNVMGKASVLAEGRSYYLVLKALDHLQRYAEYKYLTAVEQLESGNARETQRKTGDRDGASVGIHNLFTSTDAPEFLIPEWKTERLFMINEPRFRGGPTLRTPYAALASRNDDLLVVLRRPLTTYEARLALYNQHSFKYLFNFTGEVHDGASTIFQTLSGVVEFALHDFYVGKTIAPETPTRVTVVGADLPSSGAAVILATHIQRVLEEKFASSEAALVTAVSFGSPYVSDSVFANYAAKQIEVRSLVVQGDSIDLFPCQTTYSCDERILPPRTGIETGKLYNYAALPGQVRISLDDLAEFESKWAQETSRLQLAAIRDCAYQCYLTKKFCSVDTETRCSPDQCEAWV